MNQLAMNLQGYEPVQSQRTTGRYGSATGYRVPRELVFNQDRHIFAEWRVLSVVPHLMERVAKESNLHPGWIRVFLFLPLSSQKLIWRISTKVEAYNMRIGQRYRNSSTIAPLTQVDDWRIKPSPVEHSTPATLQPPTATPRSEVDIVEGGKRAKKKVSSYLYLASLCQPPLRQNTPTCGDRGGHAAKEGNSRSTDR